MVILNLELNHILAFNDFIVNFSYPRKLNRSAIENENLQDIPSFRYKKLNWFECNGENFFNALHCLHSAFYGEAGEGSHQGHRKRIL